MQAVFTQSDLRLQPPAAQSLLAFQMPASAGSTSSDAYGYWMIAPHEQRCHKLDHLLEAIVTIDENVLQGHVMQGADGVLHLEDTHHHFSADEGSKSESWYMTYIQCDDGSGQTEQPVLGGLVVSLTSDPLENARWTGTYTFHIPDFEKQLKAAVRRAHDTCDTCAEAKWELEARRLVCVEEEDKTRVHDEFQTQWQTDEDAEHPFKTFGFEAEWREPDKDPKLDPKCGDTTVYLTFNEHFKPSPYA